VGWRSLKGPVERTPASRMLHCRSTQPRKIRHLRKRIVSSEEFRENADNKRRTVSGIKTKEATARLFWKHLTVFGKNILSTL
jgi:hypothetical protein